MSIPDGIEESEFSRRELMAFVVGALVVAAVPFVIGRRSSLVRRTLPLMGTIAEIGVVATDGALAQAAIDAAFEALGEVERRMTHFDETSEIGRANLHAFQGPVEISADTAEVLEEALRWAENSDGRFDPCLGKLFALWDVTQRHEPPDAEATRALAGRKLYRKLELSSASGRRFVRFHDPAIQLDLGGIAKGYGVDRAVAALRGLGIASALVNVGGDLYALGHSENGDPWKVGIRNPSDPDAIAQQFEVADEAVATSGDYLQFFEFEDRRYHHLLDAEQAEPHQTTRHSITIAADRCITADAAATTLFGMPLEEAETLLRRCAPDARIILPT